MTHDWNWSDIVDPQRVERALHNAYRRKRARRWMDAREVADERFAAHFIAATGAR